MIESISVLGIIIGLISILIFSFFFFSEREIESESFGNWIIRGFLFGVISLVVFIGHNLIYSDPEIYIDNYSGKDVQIFIDEKHIGGYVELKALENKGELDILLKN